MYPLLLEFAALIHLAHDVATADEFALYIKLGMVGQFENSLML